MARRTTSPGRTLARFAAAAVPLAALGAAVAAGPAHASSAQTFFYDSGRCALSMNLGVTLTSPSNPNGFVRAYASSLCGDPVAVQVACDNFTPPAAFAVDDANFVDVNYGYPYTSGRCVAHGYVLSGLSYVYVGSVFDTGTVGP